MTKLRGTFTALVSPMNKDGSLDLVALQALVDWQIKSGIDGLVPCGTTGEAATMTSDERLEVISCVVKQVNGRVPVLGGTGANGTQATIENQRRAKETGIDFGLVVTPYYNKPSPEGLYRHYAAVAEATDLPIVLYNVPGRTGCDMLPETVARVAKLPTVVGIKEATADLLRVATIRKAAGPQFAILSGDDFTACPFALLGGDGLISVSTNVAPKDISKMIEAALAGRAADARALHDRLQDLFSAMFYESNPIPVKAAVALAGRIQEVYRLPLCEMGEANKAKLKAVLRAGEWI